MSYTSLIMVIILIFPNQHQLSMKYILQSAPHQFIHLGTFGFQMTYMAMTTFQHLFRRLFLLGILITILNAKYCTAGSKASTALAKITNYIIKGNIDDEFDNVSMYYQYF